MPLILVVEQEKRYVERIEQALSPQGWEVLGVEDRAAAMQEAAAADVAVLVVNAEVAEASELVDFFGRGNGGPGAVVLVPESSDEGASDMSADEVLHKPFTDQEISLAVRRCVSAAQSGPTDVSADDDVQLTSEDIFGDVVLELEGAFSLATGKGAESPEQAAPVEAAAEEPAQEPAAPEPAAEAEGDEEAVADEDVEVEAEAPDAEAVETEEPEPDHAAAEEEEGELEEADEAEVEAAPEEEAPEEQEPETAEVEEQLEEEIEPDEPVAEGVDEEGVDDEAVRAATSLLDQELGSLRSREVKIDDEFTRPAEVTDAEIDAMVRSAIVGLEQPATERAPEPGAELEGAGDDAEVGLEFEDAALDGDVEEAEAAAGGSRPNTKLLVAIILLALAAVLAYVLWG